MFYELAGAADDDYQQYLQAQLDLVSQGKNKTIELDKNEKETLLPKATKILEPVISLMLHEMHESLSSTYGESDI